MNPLAVGFDAAVQFAPDWKNWTRPAESFVRRAARRAFRPSSPYRTNLVFDYNDVMARTVAVPEPDYKLYRCVSPGFDSTPRRPDGGATILTGSTPDAYGHWLSEALRRATPYSADENLLFVNLVGG